MDITGIVSTERGEVKFSSFAFQWTEQKGLKKEIDSMFIYTNQQTDEQK